jgi:hypothetical protein
METQTKLELVYNALFKAGHPGVARQVSVSRQEFSAETERYVTPKVIDKLNTSVEVVPTDGVTTNEKKNHKSKNPARMLL